MIRLQGLRMPTDIDIAFTGLRPGEKLHEKLFFDDEQPVGTEHPRVLRVTNTDVPAVASLRVVVRTLEDLIGAQDQAGALKLVMNTVVQHDRSVALDSG